MDGLELMGLKRIILVPSFIYKDEDLFNEYVKIYDNVIIDNRLIDDSDTLGLLDLLSKNELAMFEVWRKILVDFNKFIKLIKNPLIYKISTNYDIITNTLNLYNKNYSKNPNEFKVKMDIYIKSLIVDASNALDKIKSMENIGGLTPLYFIYTSIINKYINDASELKRFLLDKKLLISEYNPEDLTIYTIIDDNVMLYIYGLVEKYNESSKENPIPKNMLANILFTSIYDRVMDTVYIGNKSAVINYKSRPDIVNKHLLSLNIAMAKAV